MLPSYLPDLNSNVCSHIEVDKGAAVQRVFSAIITNTGKYYLDFWVQNQLTDNVVFLFISTHSDIEFGYSEAVKQNMMRKTAAIAVNNIGYFLIISITGT